MAPLNPQLQDIVAQLASVSASAAALARVASDVLFTRRVEPESWSAAEAIEHLNLTSKAFLPRLDAALEEGEVRGLRGDGPYRLELLARLLKWSLEPPPRLRTKTSAPFQPVAIASPERVIPEFLELQQEIVERVRRADGLALGKLKIRSPFAESVKYNVYSAFALIAAHERRHVWQAEHALEQHLGVGRR